MTNTEKILLGVGVALSWGFGFLIRYTFADGFDFWLIVTVLLLGALFWLAPFVLLLLFSEKMRFQFLAFLLGSAGFLLAVANAVMLLGLLLLLLGFTYWILRVRYANESSPGFSVTHGLQGIGMFFTILAVFGALLYFYSPFASRASVEAHIPEGFFDAIYYPLTGVFFSQGNGGAALPVSEEELKPQIYKVVNTALADLSKKYQRYLPFAFAAGTFFFLRAIFIPFKYLLLALAYLIIELFLKLGWLKREKIQVEREEVKF